MIGPGPLDKMPTMSPKMSPNVVPTQKMSRRERKAENRKLTDLLNLTNLREDAQSARDTYEARMAGESARSAYEAKQKMGTPLTDNLIKRSMSSQAFKEIMPAKETFKKTAFKDMTPAQQKQYRAGIASGKEFTVEGIGKYAAASKKDQALSARMAAKEGKEPLVKMKEDSWTEPQWQDFLKNRKIGRAHV